MTDVAVESRRSTRRLSDAVAIPAGLIALVAVACLSVAIGPTTLSWDEIVHAVTAPTGTEADLIVREVRLPRTILGLAAGAALAVAGVVMQALTRNPLAEPGILGINAGASFAVAVGIVVLDLRGFGSTMWLAFLGAAVTSIAVAAIGAVGRGAAIGRLVLSGVAIGAVLSGATSALSLLDPGDYQAMRLWEAGSLAGRTLPVAGITAAVVVLGLAIAFALGPSLNLLVLGEDTARALGGRVGVARAGGFAAIVVLCGAATAAVGPIAFLGLMVPHAMRALFGADQVRMLWYSALGGPILLLTADILARVVFSPREIPVGVVMAFLGAPVLVALVLSRRTGRGEAPA